MTQPHQPFSAPVPPQGMQGPMVPVYRQPDPAPAKAATKLNLDTLEREGGPKEPFEFTFVGRDYVLLDPEDVDWQDLMLAMASAQTFFQFVLPTAEDRAEFFKHKMPVWKMNVLMRRYQEHYGLPSAGEAAGSPR